MTYPDWAPKILVLLHQDGQASEQQINVYGEINVFAVPELSTKQYANLRKLITDSRMRRVWKTLGRYWREPSDAAVGLWHECDLAIESWQRSPRLTGREHKQYHQEIARKCKELGRLIGSSLFRDLNLIDWFPSDLQPKLCNIRELDYSSPTQWLTAENLLVAIGESARDIATWPTIMPRRRSENAQIIYFIRRVSGYFQKHYGKSFHGSVATLTDVLFSTPKPTEPDRVKKLLRIPAAISRTLAQTLPQKGEDFAQDSCIIVPSHEQGRSTTITIRK